MKNTDMEGFSYNNIFDTKGIEYLVIISFFAVLIPFWILLNKPAKLKEQFRRTIGILTAKALRIPQGLFYSGNHTWTHLGISGIARVGLDDFLLHITGEVTVRNIRQPGEKIKKGELMAILENKGRSLGILSPISGEISSTNALLEDEPGILLEDPYREGWIYGIKPENWVAETSSFHIAADATVWFERELERFRDFLSQSLSKITPESSGLVLQDGGELTDHTLAQLPQEVWKDFQNDFLSRTG